MEGLTPPEFNSIVSFTPIVVVTRMLLGRTAVAINVLLNDCLVNSGLITIAIGDGLLLVILAVVNVSNVVVALPLNALPVVNPKLEVGVGWVETALVSANVNSDDVRLSMWKQFETWVWGERNNRQEQCTSL